MRWAGQVDSPKTDTGAETRDDLASFAGHSPALSERHGALTLAAKGVLLVIAGVLVGAIVVALEKNPTFNYQTIYYLSFPSGSLGVWILATVVIACGSRTPRGALVGTLCFLGAVLLSYFAIRYANYMADRSRVIESMSETLDGRYNAFTIADFWTSGKLAAFNVALVAVLLAGLDAWGLKKLQSRSGWYWLFAVVPLFLVVFEAWSYFVPMTLYAGVDWAPAVVDTVGALVIAALVVNERRKGLEAAAANA